MKAEFSIPQEIVDLIADRVVQKMLPILETFHAPDHYMNVDELSELIGKSKGQIYQWVDRASHGLSDFPYNKAGRSLRFSRKEIDHWLRKRQKR